MPVAMRLRCSNRTWICAEGGGGGDINATRAIPREWETFVILNPPRNALPINHGDSVCLVCYNDQFICAENGGGNGISANRGEGQIWETFTILHTDGSAGEILDGQNIALKTFDNQHYVCAEGGGGGEVNATRLAIGPWETFTVDYAKGAGDQILDAPLEARRYTKIAAGQYMESYAQLQSNGDISAQTKIWTTNRSYGFTGQTLGLVYDQANNCVAYAHLGSWGVNGTSVPGAPSERSPPLVVKNVGADKYGNAIGLKLGHSLSPNNQLLAFLEDAVRVGKKVQEVIAIVGGIFK